MPKELIVSRPSLVCLIGGAPLKKGAIAEVLPIVDEFVAVDSGADHLLDANVVPAAVIGDLDSLSDRARATFEDVLCHVAEQSTTDFEKALTRVAAPMVLALGCTGGRMDHALGVLNVLARHPERAIVLADHNDVCFLARLGRTEFTVPRGTRVAIMPLGPATVTVFGLEWSFADTLMTPAGFTSSSNAATGGEISIQTDGPVLITLPRAFLPTALKAAARAE